MIFLFKLTSIYRSLFDRLSAIDARKGSVADCFDVVLSADSKLEAAIGEIEQSGEESRSTRGEHVSAIRHASAIASWHQRVMIHRSFFCRSFQDRQYHYSRFVCLAAARNILRSFLKSNSPQMTTGTWSIPTHAISGCTIITLNSMFTAEQYTVEKSDLELMHQCLALLKNSPRPNSIVDRGIQIIQHLSNQAPQHRFKRLDLHEISQLAQDIDTPATTASLSRQSADFSSGDDMSRAWGSEMDIFGSVNSFFGDEELFMPLWYNSMTHDHSL